MSNITITDRQVARNMRRVERERLAFAASCNDGMDWTARTVANVSTFVSAHVLELSVGSIAGVALFFVGSILRMF